MKSYYGNVLADTFELIFAITALLLVWVSLSKDSIVFFGITSSIYILPRILSIIKGIVNNGRDIFRKIIDIVSLTAILLVFLLLSLMLVNYVTNSIFDKIPTSIIHHVFYILSAISLADLTIKLVIGMIQQISVTSQNYKA